MSELPNVSEKVHEVIDSELVLSNETLKGVMTKCSQEIQKGLKKATHRTSEIKCFVTYVQDLPSGEELGKFLALDLGGTNFRALQIHLKGHRDYEFQSKIYAIPESIMLGPGAELFDHIAHCLAEFVVEMKIQDEVLPLGFTFSFPCEQLGLTNGKLIKWTKGFNCSGVVNENIVELLDAAIKKRNVRFVTSQKNFSELKFPCFRMLKFKSVRYSMTPLEL